MKHYKQLGALLLALAMVLSMAATDRAAAEPSRFHDVDADADYAQAVTWCAQKGLMNGVEDGTNFDPDGSMTRAMLATILYRQAGEPKVDGEPDFTDAQPDVWYSNAVTWAAGKNLLRGYGNGLFGVDDPVSKEMLNVVIARQNGKDPTWTGGPELAVDAKRSEAAVALYETFYEPEPTRRHHWGEDARELRPGDVVYIPAGVKHWHGAAKDSWFSHIAFEAPGRDCSTQWCERVDDGQYGKLG